MDEDDGIPDDGDVVLAGEIDEVLTPEDDPVEARLGFRCMPGRR